MNTEEINRSFFKWLQEQPDWQKEIASNILNGIKLIMLNSLISA